jgi:hypothetical protein
MSVQGWRSDRASVLGYQILGPSVKNGRFFSSGFKASQDENYIGWVTLEYEYSRIEGCSDPNGAHIPRSHQP